MLLFLWTARTEIYYVVLKEEQENGDTILATIDDDAEFDRIAAVFDNELFGEIDYDAEG